MVVSLPFHPSEGLSSDLQQSSPKARRGNAFPDKIRSLKTFLKNIAVQPPDFYGTFLFFSSSLSLFLFLFLSLKNDDFLERGREREKVTSIGCLSYTP